ncbi:hypothetical protein [Pararobbsia alpina]|uniref:Phage tail protein n=1 Tax=Pararobbsia alpina TaxID=621374 RepID=A0A6S7B7Y4_9BURK|nr:hypothetical protein [Pararobbsia alpina]CAB3790880.1 hypothetical protein LMG28138_03050 [Pararobbsia alpina]
MDIQKQLDQLAQRVNSLSVDAAAEAVRTEAPAAQPPRLQIARPAQNVITMTIAGQTVSLGPHDISEMIDQLAQARTTMLPEVPMSVAPGKPFAATKDPLIASQTVGNGEKLLVLRHSGYGWVPFSCSPRMLVDLLAVLSRK